MKFINDSFIKTYIDNQSPQDYTKNDLCPIQRIIIDDIDRIRILSRMICACLTRRGWCSF